VSVGMLDWGSLRRCSQGVGHTVLGLRKLRIQHAEAMHHVLDRGDLQEGIYVVMTRRGYPGATGSGRL
jgi:hypothetical protein